MRPENRSIVIYGFTGRSHALTDIFSHDAVSGAVYLHHRRRDGDGINLRGEGTSLKAATELYRLDMGFNGLGYAFL